MRQLFRHRFRRTTIWLWLFIGGLAGLGLAHSRASPGLLAALCLLPFVCFCFPKRSLKTLVLITLFGMLLGWWRGSIYMHKLARFDQLDHQAVTLTAVANADAIYGKTKQLTFEAHGIVLDDGEELAGQIQLTGFGVNAVFEGDVVQVDGKMYPGYGAYQGKISFAHISVLEHHPSVISNIKRKFVAGTQSALPEPLAPFVMGLLVGQRATLPANVKEDLQKVGLTHIIAVSGANLTIILQASQKLLGKRSKRISTGLTVALIMVFLILSGASASIVRAAIVSMLSIAAGYYGRNFKPLNLITCAAVITAWANPVYLWSDLSWYLSFLAFIGVMILSPLVQARWPRKWHESIVGGVALESLCAEAMTLPFVLHIFGQMSRVGLIANVLVVAFIPLAMLLGAIAGLGGMLLGNFAGWFAWPATLLLNYMLDTAHLLANLPDIFIEGIGLSLLQMLILYASLGIVIAALWFKNDGKSAIITDINDSKVRGLLT
jgi:competence protein ComEC